MTDTIAAISSPPGAAWRGIVRLSGPQAWPIALSLLPPLSNPPAREWLNITLARPRLAMGVIFFRAPASFTGQDVVELHLPGSIPLLQRVLGQLIAAGARGAGPGEFSSRAYVNGKCDLTEAEGVAATIAATNEQELRAAQSLRCGLLHEWTTAQTNALADLLAMVEAGIDFSDEPGVSFISAAELLAAIAHLEVKIANLLALAARWETLETLPTVLLVGRANVGKSSLINTLSGQNRAIVSHHAGTTRDPLSITATTPSGPIRLVDTPGFESIGQSLYPQMDESRQQAMQQADLLVLVLDHQQAVASFADLLREMAVRHDQPLIVVRNKADLENDPQKHIIDIHDFIRVSALTGQGLENLLEVIGRRCYCRQAIAVETIALNQRHRQALMHTTRHLRRAADMAGSGAIEASLELVASDLRAALDDLGGISGIINTDDVLGRIFGRFCIGK